MWQVLGWIACAKRPFKWREIQGAVSIDVDENNLDPNRYLVDTPKGLFAALVEVQSDGSVHLVHGTARRLISFTSTRSTITNKGHTVTFLTWTR